MHMPLVLTRVIHPEGANRADITHRFITGKQLRVDCRVTVPWVRWSVYTSSGIPYFWTDVWQLCPDIT